MYLIKITTELATINLNIIPNCRIYYLIVLFVGFNIDKLLFYGSLTFVEIRIKLIFDFTYLHIELKKYNR